MKKVMAYGILKDVQLTGLKDSGETLDGELSASLLKDSQDKPRGFVGITKDIGERKRAEDALRESETKFRAMFENSRDAIGVSKKGIYVFDNPSYLHIFGFESEEALVGTSIIVSIAPSHREQVMRNIRLRADGLEVPTFYETRGGTGSGFSFRTISLKRTAAH
jgi:PAS domain S-box-containing protein